MEILKQFIDNCKRGDSRMLIIEIFNYMTNEKTFEYYEKDFEKLLENIDNLYTEKLESKTCKCKKIINFYLGYKLGEGATWLL
jgi:hypothetical protein